MRYSEIICENAAGMSTSDVANAILNYVVHFEDIDGSEIRDALAQLGMPKPSQEMVLYRALSMSVPDSMGTVDNFLKGIEIRLSATDTAFSASPAIGNIVAYDRANRDQRQFVSADDEDILAMNAEDVGLVIVMVECRVPPSGIFVSINDALEYCKARGASVDEQNMEWFVDNDYHKEQEVLADGSKCRIVNQTVVGVVLNR